MKSHYFFLLLFLLLPCTFSSKEEDPTFTHAPTETRSRFAMLDDVRILANGLLQLGRGLKDFVHKTKSQINDIFKKLNIFDKSFYELSLMTSEIKEEEEELKKTTTVLQATNEEIKNMSFEINNKINSILEDRTQLQSKVGGLEEKLSGLSESLPEATELKEISALKNVIDAQEKSITELLRAVKEQNDQLDYQRNKIIHLEEKLKYDVFQDLNEKSPSSKPKELTPVGYLEKNSTSKTFNTNGLPTDCQDIYNGGEKTSGVYPIKPNQSEPFNVYCDMTEEGGYTIMQRRMDGSVDFDQTWEKYENGFGNLESEFWLGLEKIHSISKQGDYILQIQLEDWRNEKRSIEYQFSLEGKDLDYMIHLTPISGNLPNAMTNQTGMRFSTKDQDNDNKKDSNCAENYSGGWWFNACGDTNLNGRYIRTKSRGKTDRRRGIHWKPGRGISYSLKSTKIAIRPAPDAGSFR
ncbi:angiopoietin-related protein 3 [Lepisosteus oculatus]|uniref:angiopoietin-related protein 3 n=1 Tax=Lepisosteus oculatus TaxID=7918 RepID=UPI0037176E94